MLSLDIGIDHVNNRLVIINIPHLNLDPIQPCPLRGVEPPMAADDLIPTLGAAAHGQVGQHTVLPDAVHQLLHILIVAHTLTVAPNEYAVRMIFEAGLVQNALLAAERQYIGVDTAPAQVGHSGIAVCIRFW